MAPRTGPAHVNVVVSPALERQFRVINRDLALQVAGSIEDDMKDGAPVDEGTLVGSIRRIGTTIRVSAEHWRHVEYGTRPHPITPRVKQALWWPGASHPVAHVSHPGTPAQPFIRPAVRKPRNLRHVAVSTRGL
jgi:HK97 gp10 family phage protein